MGKITELHVYELGYYDGGREIRRTATMDIKKAQQQYVRQYQRTGLAPRLYIDGEKVAYYIADKMMELDGRQPPAAVQKKPEPKKNIFGLKKGGSK